MKFNIEGFSQVYATTLKKEVTENGKKKTIKIDCTDLVILRWFVDYYPYCQSKTTIDNDIYIRISYKKFISDLPLIDINKRAFMDRMHKLVEFKILKYRLIKEGGTFSWFSIGENYINLVNDTKEQNINNQENKGGVIENTMQSNNIGGVQSNNIGVCSQPTHKYNSIIYNSINILDKDKSKIKGDKRQNALIEPTCLTEVFIRASIINKNDFDIPRYNKLFNTLANEYGIEMVRSALWYTANQIKLADGVDQNGKRIESMYSYIKNAVTKNLKQLEINNKMRK